MFNMKFLVLSTTMMLLGIADAGARPLLYAWGGHFDHTNGGQAYVINPIEATVLALHGRGQSNGGDIREPQHHTGFGYERKGFGGGPGGPGSGGSSSGTGRGDPGGSGGSGSSGQAFGQPGGDGNGPNGPLGDVDPLDDPEVVNNPHYPPWTPEELPSEPPENEVPSGTGDGVPPAVSTAVVPEPGTLALFGIAFAVLGARSRRRKS